LEIGGPLIKKSSLLKNQRTISHRIQGDKIPMPIKAQYEISKPTNNPELRKVLETKYP
jgi:hypothetical protein